MRRLYQCIFLLFYCHLGEAAKKCTRGHYFVSVSFGQAVCAPCQDGSFMPDDDHTNLTCLVCSKITNRDVEILVGECNRTHDSVILCQPGYYRFKASSAKEVDRCVVCSQCDVLARACQGVSDAVCCRPGDICAVKDRVVYEVKERSRHNASDQVEAFRDLMNTSGCGFIISSLPPRLLSSSSSAMSSCQQSLPPRPRRPPSRPPLPPYRRRHHVNNYCHQRLLHYRYINHQLHPSTPPTYSS